MGFVQIIEFDTDRFDEMRALGARWWEETAGRRTVVREIWCRDRNRANHYVAIVEFASHEDAETNNGLPETKAGSEALAKLATTPPAFADLDVIEVRSA
jgi:quinol monooxygenase YgiN